jgi:hypothetical protein
MAFGYQVKAVDTVLSMYPEITRYILGATYTVAIQKQSTQMHSLPKSSKTDLQMNRHKN